MWCLQRESWAACQLECENTHSGSLFQKGIGHFLKETHGNLQVWEYKEKKERKDEGRHAEAKKAGKLCK